MKKVLKKRKSFDCVCDSDGAIVDKNWTNITFLNEKGVVVREEVYNLSLIHI